MERNYTAHHYIQEKLAGYSPKFVRCVTNCLNHIDQIQEDSGCVSCTVALYVCARECGLNPRICYGLCTVCGSRFYHTWLELDGMVIDLGIYGNIDYNVMLTGLPARETPYIGPYDNDEILYEKFIIDDGWEDWEAAIAFDFMTVELYIDGCPGDAIWKLICKMIGRGYTKENVEELRRHVAGIKMDQCLEGCRYEHLVL